MKIKIEVDVEPEEARAFFGLPDVTGFNDMIVEEMSRRAKDQMDTLADPERLVMQWINMSGKGLSAAKTVMGAAAMAGASAVNTARSASRSGRRKAEDEDEG